MTSMSDIPICYCTFAEGKAWEDPDHPCQYHCPKDQTLIQEAEDAMALEPPC